MPRAALALLIAVGVQSVQYRSPAGVEYRALADTDAIRSARTAVAAEPKNVARLIDLGVAESGARQFREAIATFTRGLEIEPNNALLLRWRGHRYLSVREFDRAYADLSRGATLDATIYGIWYHLGVVQYVRGDFSAAATAFTRAQAIAPESGELQGSTDWLWMSLSRAGRAPDAKAMLDRRPDAKPDFKPVTNAYTRRLQLYRGEIAPDVVITAADTDDVQIATLAYGVGNWYLVRGDKAKARAWFERSVQSGGWPAFGFIASEADLRRAAVPTTLSEPVRAHVKDERFQIVTSIRGMPLGVREDLQRWFGSYTLDIAEPGAEFQAAGVVNPRLPTRRLVRAGCSMDHCLVYYERGGSAHTWHVALFHWTPEATKLECGGLAPKGLASVEDVRKAMLSGAIRNPAGVW